MEYCQNCGEQVSPDDRFCDNCRADLSAGDGPERRGSDQSTDQQSGQGNQPGQQRRQGGQGNQSGQPTGQQRRQGRQSTNRQQGQRATGQQSQPATGQRGQRAGGQQQLPQNTNGVFGFGFGYPVRDGWGPLLISSVLVLVSFLIVPLAIVAGYGFRVARAAATGQANPPEFGDWGGLIFDGFRLLAAMLAPMILLVAVTFGLLTLLGDLGALLVPLLFAAFFLLFYGWYAFLTAFVGSNSVIAAFTDGRAVSLVTSVYYLKSIVFFILFSIAFSVLATLASLTFVGVFIASAFQILAFGAFWGYVYYQAAQRGIVPAAEPDSRSTGRTGGGPEQSKKTTKSPY
jgi:hypothetical protein